MNHIIEMNMDLDKVLRNSFLRMTQIRLQNLEEQAGKEPRPNPTTNPIKPVKTAN